MMRSDHKIISNVFWLSTYHSTSQNALAGVVWFTHTSYKAHFVSLTSSPLTAACNLILAVALSVAPSKPPLQFPNHSRLRFRWSLKGRKKEWRDYRGGTYKEGRKDQNLEGGIDLQCVLWIAMLLIVTDCTVLLAYSVIFQRGVITATCLSLKLSTGPEINVCKIC